MNIIRLAPGGQASFFCDRIDVWQDPSGTFAWSGAVSRGNVATFGLGGDGTCSQASAEAEGIVWAQSHGSRMLVIRSGHV